MNRRQKIIVSVTGIFLVLLLLVGLTYAYFLTRITGNTNDKSISVTTANLALVYGDGNGIITSNNIQPGDTLNEKTFTVKNEGNATTGYVVVIENVKVTDIATGSTTTFESNDFTYTLTCESGCNSVEEATTFPINGGILVGNNIEVGATQNYRLIVTYEETGIDQSNDMNKTLEAKVNIKDISSINPYENNKNSLAYNIINNAKLGTTGTKLSAVPETIPALEASKVELTDKIGKTMLPYSKIEFSSSWKYADTEEDTISGDSISGKNCKDLIGKYIYDPSPAFNGTEEGGTYFVEDCQGNIPVITGWVYEYEQVLSQTADNYGTSYYYRGEVIDNYVNFGGMCWRIVRIEGDGSVKLLLENQNSTCETYDGSLSMLGGVYGYKYDFITNSSGLISSEKKYTADYINSSANTTSSFRYKLNNWLESSRIDTSKLKQDEWCLTNPEVAYDSIYNSTNYTYEDKAYSVTLKCEGNNYIKYSSYVGTLTADEVIFAGAKVGTANRDYWLVDKSLSGGTTYIWATLTLSKYDDSGDWPYGISSSDYYFGIAEQPVRGDIGLRPSITLKVGVEITGGNGTISNPYIVS